MRIDQLLVHRKMAHSRSQAQRLIAGGVPCCVGGVWRTITKNGEDVPEDAPIQLQDTSELRYVSRGGLKLEAALQHLGLAVHGCQCLDVGQSTGGFTDCLLQHGASRVVGVDVGIDQLHPSLRNDSRVVCLEKRNARTLHASDLIAAYADWIRVRGHFDPQKSAHMPTAFLPIFDLIVVDLSFISQTLVLPALIYLLAPEGLLLSLVKPQFELQPAQIGKGGIVKDTVLYAVVEQRLRESCMSLGWEVMDWFDSGVTGGDGNREFFMRARHATQMDTL